MPGCLLLNRETDGCETHLRITFSCHNTFKQSRRVTVEMFPHIKLHIYVNTGFCGLEGM